MKVILESSASGLFTTRNFYLIHKRPQSTQHYTKQINVGVDLLNKFFKWVFDRKHELTFMAKKNTRACY